MEGIRMKTLYQAGFVALMWLFIYPSISHGQRAEAPVYKNGAWWRIKHEVTRVGFDVSGTCQQAYPENIIRIDNGKASVFGLNGDQQTPINCPLLLTLVLARDELKFPLYVGLAWSASGTRQVPGMKPMNVDNKYEVASWEKITTPKGEFDVFKITKSFLRSAAGFKGIKPSWQTQTYFYAPSVKAVVQHRADEENAGESFTQITTVVDFGLVQ